MPRTTMLIRHAEKPASQGPPHGVTEDGSPDGESLTPRGWQRAGALVGYFSNVSGGSGTSGLPVPTHLFASAVGPQSSSRRPLETLQPLAQRLGLEVDTRFRKEEIGPLSQVLAAIDGHVLVAWEHNLLPSLTLLMVGPRARVPHLWPDDRFDIVWVLREGAPGAAPRFGQLTQGLLVGDSADPISLAETVAPKPPPAG